ncbi:MAG TPA: hypothetical protein VKV40_02715 [Ktedonobacteraceae bacterium]|nr:hypothetical protein [Ktedonobacteraceae bacterium]
MLYVFASNPLAAWGQAAAILLVIELFFFVLIGLALMGGLMFGLSWLREKTELIKKLRPTVEGVNTKTEEAIHGTLPPAGPHENKVIHTIAEVPAKIDDVEKKIDQGADKVAEMVIEFRARTVMVESIVKAFFAPKTVRRELEKRREEVGFASPGYRMLVEEKVPEAPNQIGDAFVGAVRSGEVRDASTP